MRIINSSGPRILISWTTGVTGSRENDTPSLVVNRHLFVRYTLSNIYNEPVMPIILSSISSSSLETLSKVFRKSKMNDINGGMSPEITID